MMKHLAILKRVGFWVAIVLVAYFSTLGLFVFLVFETVSK